MPRPLLIALLVCIACGLPAIWYMVRWRLTPLQAFLLLFNRLLNRVLWRTQINRPLPVPRGQGAVVIANHRSSFDPMFIAVSTRRLVHWMVAREYCLDWRFGWFFRGMGSIPTGRSGIDSGSTKRVIRLASTGHLVGLMPEGRINESEQLLLPGRPGAALIALKARVPVIPCYIEGAPYGGTPMGPFTRRAHVKVTVGEPLDLSEFYDRDHEPGVLEELTKRFLVAIAHLAGDDKFVPQLAGRHWKPDVADEAAPGA
jgi:1-acyl-sn-glycerol-3-phosphate acyltransferase